MELDITNFRLDKYQFNKNDVHKIVDCTYSKDFPVVYILYDFDKKKAYVGESTNALQRMKQHLANSVKKELKCVCIVSSPYFNKSAVLDIESNLIEYMSSEQTFKLLNGNGGIQKHNFFQRDSYFEIFKNIWKDLKLSKIVSKDIIDIENSDLFKYSPYKSLSQDQNIAIVKYLNVLLNNDESKVFIEGSAGTGKTILAVYLMKLLTSEYNMEDYDDNELIQKLKTVDKIRSRLGELSVAIVVPMTSLRNTLKNVFKSISGLTVNMVIGPSDVVKRKYDILIVDEAHRLKRRKAHMGMKNMENNSSKLGLDISGTQLDWILIQSKHQLFFYDSEQSIRPSDVVRDDFVKCQKDAVKIRLESQMRAQGGTGYIDFVHNLLNPNNNNVFESFKHKRYDLRLFDSMPKMIKLLEEKEKEYGLCRMISGYSWKWISQKDDEPKNNPDVCIDGVDLYWNKKKNQKDWINSTNSMNEMGCIHTTQGYDLNYAGIIFGEEIVYNEITGMIEVLRENYYDRNGKATVDSLDDLKEYIVKIYKTMMFRGIKGTYVYCCDPNLRKYFSRYIAMSRN